MGYSESNYLMVWLSTTILNVLNKYYNNIVSLICDTLALLGEVWRSKNKVICLDSEEGRFWRACCKVSKYTPYISSVLCDLHRVVNRSDKGRVWVNEYPIFAINTQINIYLSDSLRFIILPDP